MAFLTKTELKSAIRINKLNRIADEDDMIIAQAINTAITEAKSRLTSNHKKVWLDGRPRYDVDAIFAASAEERNPLILDITKVIALWWLIMRNNTGVDYEVIAARYQFSIDYLKDLATGEANDGTLPLLVEDDTSHSRDKETPFRLGSRRKFRHE